jgi:arginyl-tRNA synthetase
MDIVYSHITDRIATAVRLPAVDAVRLPTSFGRPPSGVPGDVAVPCFPIAGRAGAFPAEVATSLATVWASDRFVERAEARGPYLNLHLRREVVGHLVLEHVDRERDQYGSQNIGRGQTIVLDYSSPNIAKPFHFGHLRSTNLGAALARVWEALGFRIWRQNHLGDWGTQFGLVAYAWREYGEERELLARAVEYLAELYVRASREAAEDPRVQECARTLFRRLEGGDPELLALWRRFREMSIATLQSTYERLGVTFDSYEGEAAMNGKVGPLVERFLASGVARTSSGAVVVDVADVVGRSIVPCMLRKSDGATTYAARDCAAAIDRWERHRFVANIYVCARQEDHFAQVFAALHRLSQAEGWPVHWPPCCENVSFGFVRGMSTRSGQVVWLDRVLNEARERARTLRLEKQRANPDFPPLAEVRLGAVSEAVGKAAVLFFDLSARRMTDVTFNWDNLLTFEGNTGPYLQYTHARIAGLFRKAGEDPSSVLGRCTPTAGGMAWTDEAWSLVRGIGEFPRAVRSAGEQREPHEIASYALSLCGEFNRFYAKTWILDPREAERSANHLRIAAATRVVLQNALHLLGIEPLEVM